MFSVNNGSVTINGVSYTGNNITINGSGEVVVDGVSQTTIESKNISVYVNSESCGDITTTSGDVKIETGCVVGDIKTVSGDINCHSNVDGSVNTVSGDVTTFGNICGGVKTVSGDISGV